MRRRPGWHILLLLLLAGAVAGTVVGQAAAPSVPFLGESISIGLEPPFVFDSSVLKVTFGFLLRINICSVLGMVFGYIAYRKL